MVLKRSSDVKALPVEHATSTEIQWLISSQDGAPNFELRKFRMKPGGRIFKHYHPDIEHEQYVLNGSYIVGIGDKEYSVNPGDALLIPAGTPHWYENKSEEDAVFLCIIPRREKYESLLLEEGKSTC